MRKTVIVISIVLTACGLSSRNNELVGQVKKVVDRTPLVCPDYTEVDISLGVMRNGVGSMSHEDVVLYVAYQYIDVLKKAAEDGALVKAHYDHHRVSLCQPNDWLVDVSMVEAK